MLAGCGTDTGGQEVGASVEALQQEQEPAERAASDAVSFVGTTGTVIADVNEIISERAFTIADTENTATAALLVIATQHGRPGQRRDPRADDLVVPGGHNVYGRRCRSHRAGLR